MPLGDSKLFSMDWEQSTQWQEIGQGPGAERHYGQAKEVDLNSEGVLEPGSALGREINGEICRSRRSDAGSSTEDIPEKIRMNQWWKPKLRQKPRGCKRKHRLEIFRGCNHRICWLTGCEHGCWWGLSIGSKGERDVSNESQVYGLGDQVDNGIIYQARKYRMNCSSGRNVLNVFWI